MNIIPLTYIDDIGAASRCGETSMKLNTYITTNIEAKKLKFNEKTVEQKGKCFKIYVGSKKSSCRELKVHDSVMTDAEEIEYLGEIISSDGKNTKNVKTKISKGMGLVSEIIDILDNLKIGHLYFE